MSAQLKKGDLCIWIDPAGVERNAVVANTPHAHSDSIRLTLSGLSWPAYYKRGEVRAIVGGEKIELPPATARPEATAAPALPPPPLVITPAPAPAPPAIPDSYAGDLTLERILQRRTELRGSLEALDEEILQIRVYTMVRRGLDGINFKGEVALRAGLSGAMLKLQRQTDSMAVELRQIRERQK